MSEPTNLEPGDPISSPCICAGRLDPRSTATSAGVYLHHRHLKAIELLKEGDFRKMAQRLAVGQSYAADAHVNCYHLTALGPVLERYGNRGYRLAPLECSLYAGKVHLATHALGSGRWARRRSTTK
jgi:hypothetical protein